MPHRGKQLFPEIAFHWTLGQNHYTIKTTLLSNNSTSQPSTLTQSLNATSSVAAERLSTIGKAEPALPATVLEEHGSSQGTGEAGVQVLASSEHSRPRPLLWPVLERAGEIGECGMALRRCMDGVRGTPHLAHSDCTNRRRTTTDLCLYCVLPMCTVSGEISRGLFRGFRCQPFCHVSRAPASPAARFKKEP